MPTKKNVKVRDMKPKKDAKGGGSISNRGHAVNTTTNTTKPSGHRGHSVN